MLEHNVDPVAYMDYVHDIDLTPVCHTPELDYALAHLPGRKLIFTNGSRRHAERVAGRLGILHAFEAIWDIEACGYVPKPQAAAYASLLTGHGLEPAAAAMFEDLPHNLEEPHALGMTTVLVVPDGTREVLREGWEVEGRDAPHVDHVTDNLAGFLKSLTAAKP